MLALCCNMSLTEGGNCTEGACLVVDMQDVMKCTEQEIFQQASEKMHPNLNQAFQEAGTPAVSGLAAGKVGGTADTVIAAARTRGQARLHRVIRSLTGSAGCLKASYPLLTSYLKACERKPLS
jgi:hypothetical protein